MNQFGDKAQGRRGRWQSRVYFLLARARRRAHEKGMEFSIDVEWALQKLVEQQYRCARTGIPLRLVCPRRGDTNSPFSPSLDRKDITLGYTKDNTEIVSYMYNTCKNRFSDDEVLEFCIAFCRRHNIVIDNKSEEPRNGSAV